MAEPRGGPVAAAGRGIRAPSQGSTVQDIGRLGAGFLGGVLEERKRQEEMALREAMLALQERQVEVAEGGLELSREQLSQQASQFDLSHGLAVQQQQTYSDYVNAQVLNWDRTFQRDEERHDAAGAGYRAALVDRFGQHPDVVEQLDPSSAKSLFDHQSALERGAQEATALVSSEQLRVVGMLNDVAQRELQQQRSALESAEMRLNQVLDELPIDRVPMDFPVEEMRGQFIRNITDPVARLELSRWFLEQTPQGQVQIEHIDMMQQRVLEAERNLQDSMERTRQMLGNPNILGSTVPFAGSGRPGAVNWQQPASYSEAPSGVRTHLRNTFAETIATDPMTAVEFLPQLQEWGLPVQEIIQQTTGLEMEQWLQQLDAAQQEAAGVTAPVSQQTQPGPQGQPFAEVAALRSQGLPPAPGQPMAPLPQQPQQDPRETLYATLQRPSAAPSMRAPSLPTAPGDPREWESPAWARHLEKGQTPFLTELLGLAKPIAETVGGKAAEGFQQIREAAGEVGVTESRRFQREAERWQREQQLPRVLQAARELYRLGEPRDAILEAIQDEELRKLVEQRLPNRAPR